ncbi:MAG: hypothetical protein IIB95_10140 [Candidatus Marinimicrobia bacterium]|nr:hypothetical protein [Candidatus Neomarinimicrobiota bacterium]MCH7826688.1 hypothetical protein [Bacteroidota bacterium]MCH8170139.1 hypothetical protein [Bacteroidota bacterium]
MKDILIEIKNIKESKKDLRKFGISVGIVLLIISTLLFWNDKSSYLYFSVAGILLNILGLFYPVSLKPINKVWMSLAIVLGWVMTRVILIILFYIVLTPIGIIAKLVGKKFLKLKIDKSSNSYWEVREKKDFNPSDFENQF